MLCLELFGFVLQDGNGLKRNEGQCKTELFVPGIRTHLLSDAKVGSIVLKTASPPPSETSSQNTDSQNMATTQNKLKEQVFSSIILSRITNWHSTKLLERGFTVCPGAGTTTGRTCCFL